MTDVTTPTSSPPTERFSFSCSCGTKMTGTVPTNQAHHRARVRWLRRIFRELHAGPTHRRIERPTLAVAVEDERRLREAIGLDHTENGTEMTRD